MIDNFEEVMKSFPPYTQEERDALIDEIEEYEQGLRRTVRLQEPVKMEQIRCEYCGSSWNESESHPGTCVNCGAPPERFPLFFLAIK